MSDEHAAGHCYADDIQPCLGKRSYATVLKTIPPCSEIPLVSDDAATCVTNILDWLNDDCWRVVLDYVPVKDIVRSERVCRRWQGVVHRYLQDVGVCLVSIRDTFEHQDATMLKLQPKNRIHIMQVNGYESKPAAQFMERWGPCIVYSYCPAGPQGLLRIARSCPNLKSISIELAGLGTGNLSREVVEFLEKLERIAFMDYTNDDNLDDTMDMCDEETRNAVFFYRKVEVASAFWRNFRPTNLKSLTFRGSFDFCHFLSAVGCYPKLTELNLQGSHGNAHLLFEKMPNLERLCVICLYQQNVSFEESEKVRESVWRGLRCLKHLIVWETRVDDGLLKAVLTGCRGLRSLDLRGIGISGITSLNELCKALAPTLTDARFINVYTVTDDDLETLVRSCPNLMSLDLRICESASSAFLAKVARAARGLPGPLRLHFGGYEGDTYREIVKTQAQYSELIVEVEPPPEHAYYYEDSFRPRQYIWGIEDHRDYRDRSMKYI